MMVLSIKDEIYSPESFTTQQNLFNRHTTVNLPHKPNLAPNSYHTHTSVTLLENITSLQQTHIHAAVTRLHSLASTDTDTYMDRQTDTLGQHNTYLLTSRNRHTCMKHYKTCNYVTDSEIC